MAGAGLSIKMRKTDQVGVVFFGDGASNRGPVHEAMNMAAIWKLPVLFVVENNGWASTTPQSSACALGDLCPRAAGYNMPGYSVDGNDVLAVRATTLKAVAAARKGEGPSMIENKTYRIRGHFEGDPQKYRDQAEVLTWQEKNDPIQRFEERLVKDKVLTKKEVKVVWDEVKAELDAAIEFAKSSPYPKPEDALEDLYVNP
jgi:pyruvate dehydrogenase E1 component alpha subunit